MIQGRKVLDEKEDYDSCDNVHETCWLHHLAIDSAHGATPTGVSKNGEEFDEAQAQGRPGTVIN
ncbi:hypothetical protein RvY_06792 [Ramazzottius varieornatus]|uniref:Uncharacterized protein n=1 Tax=Ramazzottius varieornatus TaxID=947166 RepID=A0A1D1V620_RAMVA|nr:hypothetical protein RvY_06792 [Ramazzottius varieornatus]